MKSYVSPIVSFESFELGTNVASPAESQPIPLREACVVLTWVVVKYYLSLAWMFAQNPLKMESTDIAITIRTMRIVSSIPDPT